jgi:hypothetical protein
VASARKADWAPAAAVLAPVVIAVLLLATPGLPHSAILAFGRRNWGNIASVWGLCISVYVLFIAKGARKAAEEAVAIEKVRTVLELLEAASEKSTHVGLFARAGKWDLVQLRAEEIMTMCRAVVAEWGDNELLKDSRNKLLTVATVMRSIVEESGKPNVSIHTIVSAQLNATEKLSVVMGKAHKGARHSGSD